MALKSLNKCTSYSPGKKCPICLRKALIIYYYTSLSKPSCCMCHTCFPQARSQQGETSWRQIWQTCRSQHCSKRDQMSQVVSEHPTLSLHSAAAVQCVACKAPLGLISIESKATSCLYKILQAACATSLKYIFPGLWSANSTLSLEKDSLSRRHLSFLVD